MFRKLGIFYTLCRKLGIFYTLRLAPEAKTRTLIGFIAKKHCEEKNLSSEKIRHTSMVNSWKIKKTSLPTYEDAIKKQNYNFQETSPPSYDTIVKSNMK